jgi:hypothetical protein
MRYHNDKKKNDQVSINLNIVNDRLNLTSGLSPFLKKPYSKGEKGVGAPSAGLGPATARLTAECSTN